MECTSVANSILDETNDYDKDANLIQVLRLQLAFVVGYPRQNFKNIGKIYLQLIV